MIRCLYVLAMCIACCCEISLGMLSVKIDPERAEKSRKLHAKFQPNAVDLALYSATYGQQSNVNETLNLVYNTMEKIRQDDTLNDAFCKAWKKNKILSFNSQVKLLHGKKPNAFLGNSKDLYKRIADCAKLYQ